MTENTEVKDEVISKEADSTTAVEDQKPAAELITKPILESVKDRCEHFPLFGEIQGVPGILNFWFQTIIMKCGDYEL